MRGWKWQSGIKDGPLPSPTVLWVVSVRKKKTLIEKKKTSSWKNSCDSVENKKGKNAWFFGQIFLFGLVFTAHGFLYAIFVKVMGTYAEAAIQGSLSKRVFLESYGAREFIF